MIKLFQPHDRVLVTIQKCIWNFHKGKSVYDMRTGYYFFFFENRILNYKEYDELYKISCIEKSIDSV